MLGDGREYEVPRGSHLRGEDVQVPEGTHLQYEETMCSVRRVCSNKRVASAVRGDGQQCKEKECAVPGGSHLHY